MVEETKRELLELLRRLIAIPSVTGSEDVVKAIRFVRQWMEEKEIETELILSHGVPNLIARVGEGVPGQKRFLWASHVDVVPTGSCMRWDMPPFLAWEKDGYLYGRGSSDAKSGLAAMMIALEQLKKEEVRGTVELIISGSEENGSEDGILGILNGKRQMQFDGAVVSDPSDMCVEIAQRGLRWLEIRIHGIASHGARPYLGVNAISQAGRVIHALESIRHEDMMGLFEPELRGPSISVNKIHGGIQNNITAEECKMVLDCRMMPGQTQEQILQQIRAVVKQVVDSRCRVEYSFQGQGWDPFILNPEEPLVQCIMDVYKKVLGRPPVMRGKAGCTDASHIYKAGIPVVVLGPGNPRESHRDNEKVRIQNVADMADILTESAREFLEAGGRHSQ